MTITNQSTDVDAAKTATTKTAFTVPVLPGMEQAHIDVMAAAQTGDSSEEHNRSRARAGVTLEQAWHQETPQGTFAIVYIEAKDVEAVFEEFESSDDPYDREFREHVGRIHGIDLTEGFELPVLVLDYSATDDGGTDAKRMAFAAPILPGKEDEDRAYHEAVTAGDRADEFLASRARAGITREVTWHQPTPMGTVAVGFMEAADVEAALTALATSDDAFDRYFRDTLRSVHGIDFEDGFPPPEQILDWSA